MSLKPHEQLSLLCQTYIAQAPTSTNSKYELEIRFGTKKGHRRITRRDFNNVMQRLKSLNYEFLEETNSLKMYQMYVGRDQKQRQSNERVEIKGLDAIQEYCQTDDLGRLFDSPQKKESLSIVRKSAAQEKMRTGETRYMNPADFDDFNFRVALNVEEDVNRKLFIEQNRERWAGVEKYYRYVSRVRFLHPSRDFAYDLSVVRYSKGTSFSVDVSNVFDAASKEEFEIEIELMPGPHGMVRHFEADKLASGIMFHAKNVLCGLQETDFPVSYVELDLVGKQYLQMIQPADQRTYVRPRDFIGPNSVTLLRDNIQVVDERSEVPNIRKNFVVTDKADGERRMLFVAPSGKVYMISSSMKIIFTGVVDLRANSPLANTLIDGEYVLQDLNQSFFNQYMAFDLYFLKNRDLRALPFTRTLEDLKMQSRSRSRSQVEYRLEKLQETMEEISRNFKSVLETRSVIPLKMVTKRFFPTYDAPENGAEERKEEGASEAAADEDEGEGEEEEEEGLTIFESCKAIFTEIHNETLPYKTDGLIFTHAKFGVGGDKVGRAGRLEKTTWQYSFKWKPSSFNTIDFQVSVQKNSAGKDDVRNLFVKGFDTEGQEGVITYKTLELFVMFNQKTHGILNPLQTLLSGQHVDLDEEAKYAPERFLPSDPYDVHAGKCNIKLNKLGQMVCESGEVFFDGKVVEFRYDPTLVEGWRWVPLRVRPDKTIGNDYDTANNVWQSIHYPITETMLSTGEDIPASGVDVYYNRTVRTRTLKGLRDFHNLYVKRRLILAVSQPGDRLLDLACGKAGDLQKWVEARLGFVLGVDRSEDNIENRINGACMRYLQLREKEDQKPKVLFAVGDAALNLRQGSSALTKQSKLIMSSVFGTSAQSEIPAADRALIVNYGAGENGFQVTSCQFAIHYMFRDEQKLNGFLRNVAENTKPGGYFIGTTFDGVALYNMLSDFEQGQSLEFVNDDGQLLCSITKKYEEDTKKDNPLVGFRAGAGPSCLGYEITVFQESINQAIPEYLVNFEYLNRRMDDYGFDVVRDASALGLPSGQGGFELLWSQMEREAAQDSKLYLRYGDALSMTSQEKQISFLNRFFVYKKRETSVNAEKVEITNVTRVEEAEITLKDVPEDCGGKKKKVSRKRKGKEIEIVEDLDVEPKK